jgi:transketolase
VIDSHCIERCKRASRDMRFNILERAYEAGSNGAHIAPALSMVEIMATLYLGVMKYNVGDPLNQERDRFILSKGHGALAYYAALYEAGMISESEFLSYEQNGGLFPGQPNKNHDIGIEYSSGSLGMGLSYGIGLALSADCKRRDFQVYVLLGDGELNEGAVWESAMFAGFHHLSRVTAIIDRNQMQSDGRTEDIMELDIEPMWHACGWEVINADGHSIESLLDAFNTERTDKPRAIIAHTVKGKGVSFMENSKDWHHNILSQEQYDNAVLELRQREVDSIDGV